MTTRLVHYLNPNIHLAVSDVQADSLVNPGSFRIHIKCSKTDPFRQGCYIYIGAVKHDLSTYLVSTCPWLYLWPTLPSLRQHPPTSRGLPDHLIKMLGRWSSDVYQLYIHTPVGTIVGVANLLP